METNNTAVITKTANHNILLGIVEKSTTRNAVARKAGIPRTSFDRKLDGITDWTIPELGRVAEALDKTLWDIILPGDLLIKKAAA